MPFKALSAEASQLLAAIAALLPVSLLTRLLYHRRLVRLGRRRFWSGELVWELPTAVLCAVIGGGLAEYLGLSGLTGHAITGTVAWLGPRGLEVMAAKHFGHEPTGEPRQHQED